MSQFTRDEFVGFLRNALHYLYDPVHLRRSPLVDILGLTSEFDPAISLQHILTEAIRAFKPTEDESPQSRTWRVYDTLNLHYIRQFDHRTVATQLGISERQLRREQRLALEDLAQNLLKNLDLVSLPTLDQPIVIPDHPEDEKGKALSEELGWLKSPAMEQRIPLGEALQTVHELAQPLAQQWEVPLQIDLDPGMSNVLVIQQAVCNTLLTVLSVAIPRAAQGYITISAANLGSKIELRVVCSARSTIQLPFSDKDNASLETARRLGAFYRADLYIAQPDTNFAATLALPISEQVPVLVIDDNADWLDMLKRYAVGSRYQVVGTWEPETARSLAVKVQPAVIFLDVMMPNIDGWQIISELRNEQATCQIPIVICTVLPLEGLAMSLGVNAFLQKPVTRDQFLKTLDRQISPSGGS